VRSMTRIPGRPDGGETSPQPFGVRRVGEAPAQSPEPAASAFATPPAAVGVAPPGASPAPAAASPAPTGVTRAARPPRRWLTGLLALVAVLGVAGSIIFGLAWSNASSANSAQTAAASSARSLVVALTNFDPGTIRADFSRIESMSTGAFASQAKHYFGSSYGSQLSAAGAASRGRVVALDVQSVSGSNATVFAVVSQTYLNDKVKTPVVDTLRLVIGLTETNGRWLVSSVEVVQQPRP
jgi:Mce-associated membrane protein